MCNHVDDRRVLLLIVLLREGICDDFLQAKDVGDVCRELADEGELVALAVGDGIPGLKEGAREGLLVHKDAKSSAFQDVMKL